MTPGNSPETFIRNVIVYFKNNAKLYLCSVEKRHVFTTLKKEVRVQLGTADV
jgi:uncharacterized pyridoxamine 5'-phosphate oxidase family protein